MGDYHQVGVSIITHKVALTIYCEQQDFCEQQYFSLWAAILSCERYISYINTYNLTKFCIGYLNGMKNMAKD
jgi:hypothetical protein